MSNILCLVEEKTNIFKKKRKKIFGEGKSIFLEKEKEENMSLRRRRITGIEVHCVRKKSDASQDALRLVPVWPKVSQVVN